MNKSDNINIRTKRKAFLLLTFTSLIISTAFSQQTFTAGHTEYYVGRQYKTTSKPMVKRSQANKQTFLRSLGYTQTPAGYEIDHIIPLYQGGSDSPNNMQLLTVRQHKIKTAKERSSYSSLSYSPPQAYSYYRSSYTPPATYYSTNTYCPPLPSFEITPIRLTLPPAPPVNNYSPAFISPAYTNPGLSAGRTLYTGSRGGTYYINSNGNKTYVRD